MFAGLEETMPKQTEVTDVDRARFVAEQAEGRAKTSLRHYFNLAMPNGLSGDCAAEVNDIPRDIIQAASETAVALVLERLGVANFSEVGAAVQMARALTSPRPKPRKPKPRFPFARGYITAMVGADVLVRMKDEEVAVIHALLRLDEDGNGRIVWKVGDVSKRMPADLRPGEGADRNVADILSDAEGWGLTADAGPGRWSLVRKP